MDTPLTVYTFDVSKPIDGFGIPTFTKDSHNNLIQVAVDFQKDVAYRNIREGLDKNFLEFAKLGVEFYSSGDWGRAKDVLGQALALRPNDGPCSYVMEFLKEHNYIAPSGWQGVRILNGY